MTDHEKQANDFLQKTGATLKADLLGNFPYFDSDKESRDVYQITITRGGRKPWTFRFGQSIRNSDGVTKPTAYDVLSCVQRYDIGTFDDFCSDFGYDTDSRKAEKTYFAVQREVSECQRIFGDSMEDLENIN